MALEREVITMKIMMTRTDGRVEDLRTKQNLIRVLKATNKKENGRELNDNQFFAIATRIVKGEITTFCGRRFEVCA